jgi:hypothetical protein
MSALQPSQEPKTPMLPLPWDWIFRWCHPWHCFPLWHTFRHNPPGRLDFPLWPLLWDQTVRYGPTPGDRILGGWDFPHRGSGHSTMAPGGSTVTHRVAIEISFRKNSGNRLGTVFVIPRKKVLIP